LQSEIKTRCAWLPKGNELYIKYHDEEWGVPCHDDRMLFEMLNLEGAQAGLSWITVLMKRMNYRKLFANFEAEKLIHFTDKQLDEILLNPGIIRNRLKVYAVRTNAYAFLKVKEEFGSFDTYIWSFVDGQPIVNYRKNINEIPAKTKLSNQMSKDLKQRGFKFIGSTICYAYMQAIGMVNDHTIDCCKFKTIN